MIELMIVDDDDSYALLAERALAADPDLAGRYILERVSDGDDALQLLLARSRAEEDKARLPDLILLDHRMPRMDGTQLLEAIRSHAVLRGVPICMMSTSSDPAQIAQCYALGATFCVSKPLKYEDLAEKLRSICHFFVDVIELPISRAWLVRGFCET